MCLSRTDCAEGESPGSYQQMSGLSVCLCHRHHLMFACIGRGIRLKPVTNMWHCAHGMENLLVPGVSQLAN